MSINYIASSILLSPLRNIYGLLQMSIDKHVNLYGIQTEGLIRKENQSQVGFKKQVEF